MGQPGGIMSKSPVLKRIALLALLGLSACATPVVHNTPSGKAETTLDSTPDMIKPLLVNAMTNGGFTITKDTNYLMSFDHPVTNVMAAMLLGSRYDAIPNERV